MVSVVRGPVQNYTSVLEWDASSGNESTRINAALTWGAANTRDIFFPSYYRPLCPDPIVIKSGCRVLFDEGAELQRRCSTSGSTGFIQVETPGVKVTNVVLNGLKVRSPDYSSYLGNVFALYGDNIILNNCGATTFGADTGHGGRAMLLIGNNIQVLFPQIYDAEPVTGAGGIRYGGGDGFRCIGGHVEAGDDCLQFVGGAFGTTYANIEFTNGLYFGVDVASAAARMCIWGLGDPVLAAGVPSGLTNSIINCGFSKITGTGGGRGIVAHMHNSTGIMDDIFLEDTEVSGGDAAQLISLAGLCGRGIGKVSLRRIVTPSSPTSTVLKTSGRIGQLDLDNCSFKASNTSNATVILQGVDQTFIKAGDISASATGPAISVGPTGSSSAACKAVQIEGGIIRGISDGNYGVNALQASNVEIRGTRFLPILSSTGTSAATGGNTGNGTLSAITVSVNTAQIGVYTLTMSSATAYSVVGPNGNTIGSGTTGVAFSNGGLSFTLTAGGVAFISGDSFTISAISGSTTAKAVNFSNSATYCSAEGTDISAMPATPYTIQSGYGHRWQYNGDGVSIGSDALQATAPIYVQTSTTTVANTTTNTTLFGSGTGSLSIPANTFILGTVLRVRMGGLFCTKVAPGNATILVKLGSTTLASKILGNLPSAMTGFSWDLLVDLVCTTAGASGIIQVNGAMNYQTNANIISLGWLNTPTSSDGPPPVFNPSTVDLTAAKTLDIQIGWATADASNSITTIAAIVQQLNP